MFSKSFLYFFLWSKMIWRKILYECSQKPPRWNGHYVTKGVCRLSRAIQWNLSIADMLYSGHLSIADCTMSVGILSVMFCPVTFWLCDGFSPFFKNMLNFSKAASLKFLITRKEFEFFFIKSTKYPEIKNHSI